jgi:chitin synthase
MRDGVLRTVASCLGMDLDVISLFPGNLLIYFSRSLHQSTPSLLSPFLAAVPLSTPQIVFTAIAALRPFLTCVTPYNPATSRQSAIAATYSITLSGKVTGLMLALSLSGIDVDKGLVNVPSEAGYRAFDAFYYLLTSASTPAEREFLGLKSAADYSLLNKSGTYGPPAYLPAADDAAAAEDFRAALKAIGIKGSAYRGFLSALAGLLKLGETTKILVNDSILEEICEDVGGLIGVEPEVLSQKCTTTDREVFVAGAYEALVDWVIAKANEAIAIDLLSTQDSSSDDDSGDSVNLTVIEISGESLGKAVALRGVFDDNLGINAEMKEDGVEVVTAGHSVLREMTNAVAEVEADLGITGGPLSREREQDHDRRQGILERIGAEAEDGGFLKTLLYPVEGESLNFGTKGRFDLPGVLGSSRVWYQLSIHPTDDSPATLATLASTTSAWSAGAVSRQLRAWRLPEWANRRNKNLDFTADFDVDEFFSRYSRLGCKEGKDGVESFLLERGWSNGEVVIGKDRIWMREGAWWEAECMLDMKPIEPDMAREFGMPSNPFTTGYSANTPHNGSGFFPPMPDTPSARDSRENLLDGRQSAMGLSVMGGRKSVAPTLARTVQTTGGDYGLGGKGDDKRDEVIYEDDLGRFTGELDPEFGDPKKIQQKNITFGRRVWIAVVWALTFFIPSFALRYVGRMKRPDVRMAWREKVVLVLIILLLNGTVVFYIIEFGRLLCPNWDKAWNEKEVSYHQGDDDFWVSIHGRVYDISKFWKTQHSDTDIETNAANMQPFAGLNLDVYFEPPLSRACPGLNIDENVSLQHNNTNAVMFPQGLHTSGPRLQADPSTALVSWDWYTQKFLPKIKEYYKGDLVIAKDDIYKQGQDEARQWVIVNNNVYDLTDYFYTLKRMDNFKTYQFFPQAVSNLVKNNPGMDVTDRFGNSAAFQNSLNCMNNAFFVGKTDFRKTPRCQVNNYILLAFTIVLCAVILVKFLAALQLGSKRHPAAQDKFVICQVPAYTEGEDQLRKGLDSLTALQYDNKRKLICVICDGMIVGGGNDRPTPKIVLDILGVDPKIDPPALPFKSVGGGSEQLNYGKVYSGLYEYEGNVVPYIVVVKVGKESEQSKAKPGNRGKRDSQILLMQFLNRVHHRSAMSPLELEMFHQINNIIGVDPELYEYLLMVDADTSVKEDSLNRLVASCANDAKIAGICGETSLENEERSWWTMIQVYEYYISHHLAKAFESLFGSVTCLPGWYVYRALQI